MSNPKSKKTKCETPRCRNNSKGRRFCATCRSRQSRERDPVRYSYTNLKGNAKRRGIPFDLTFEQFQRFCRREKFIAGNGRARESHTVERVKNEFGYTEWNIIKLPKGENCSKGTKMILVYDWRTKYATVWKPEVEQSTDDLPF